MNPTLDYRRALPADVAPCIVIRGQTRENAISVARLAALGITLESWSAAVQADALPGVVCRASGQTVGYCFGERATGEVVVLALLPAFENQGIGRQLLNRVVAVLVEAGHSRLFLGCSADPQSRSYGFYRHLGWQSTHQLDSNGDELLEYHRPAAGNIEGAAHEIPPHAAGPGLGDQPGGAGRCADG